MGCFSSGGVFPRVLGEGGARFFSATLFFLCKGHIPPFFFFLLRFFGAGGPAVPRAARGLIALLAGGGSQAPFPSFLSRRVR